MADEASKRAREDFLGKTLEASIRIGLIVLLLVWCFVIVRPFVAPVLWGVVIAISTRSVYLRLDAWSGHRAPLAAAVFVVLGLVLVIGPAVGLAGTVIEGVESAAGAITEGKLAIPPPPESVTGWPIVGEQIARTWRLASTNLAELLMQFHGELKAVAGWLLDVATSVGASVLLFTFSIVIAAVFHVNAEGASRVVDRFSGRIAGPSGQRLNELAEHTIRSVTRGILGVALLQALAAGVGMVVVGVPAAGLWALLVMLVAIMQIPTALVLLPVALYVFSVASPFAAWSFLVWSIAVSLSDNVLKPVLLGRDARVPMLVVLIGALGGFAAEGLIGLFIGPIVLSVAFTLVQAWIDDAPSAEPAGTAGEPSP